jgi:hypothetical protein
VARRRRGKRARLSLLALAAAAAATAGCGGGGKTFSSESVADCLRNKNFIVSRADADYIAQANDGFYVRTSQTAASAGLDSTGNVSFGDVGQLKQTYAEFGTGRVDARGNAVVVWDRYEPTSGKLILGCLR